MTSPADDKGDTRDPTTAAIEKLVDEYGGQLFALAVRFCGNPVEAEDVVQETFLQAYRRWDTFEGRSSPGTWLYTIAARICQRMHRKRAGEPDRVGSLDALLPFGETRIAVIAAEQDDVLQEQIRIEARERVEAAIASLPVEFRVPLVLKEIIGFSVKEVAGMLSLEIGTVKSRLHRARLRLRAAVDGVMPRQPGVAPPPAYERQVCLDLLDAKQEALDHGVPFDSEIICDRCRSVFASLDLTQQVCRELGEGRLPDGLRERLVASLEASS